MNSTFQVPNFILEKVGRNIYMNGMILNLYLPKKLGKYYLFIYNIWYTFSNSSVISLIDSCIVRLFRNVSWGLFKKVEQGVRVYIPIFVKRFV